MVELKLPKNSRISNGKIWPEPENSNNVRKNIDLGKFECKD